MDAVTKENLEYVLQSHYCNSLGQSAYIRALIAKDAAEKRLMDTTTTAEREITVPQGWFGGSAGTVSVMG
jgi:hypothetical protein